MTDSRRLLAVGLSGLASVLLGCSGDTTGAAAIVAPSDLFWAVHVNYRAVNLALVAPYDTIRLVAIPLDANGTPFAGAGMVTYQAKDSLVTVDSAGLVTAHYPTASVGSPTFVIASMTVGGVTHVDTALIQVRPAPPLPVPLDTFSLQPPAGDSAKLACCGNNKDVSVYATDGTGAVLRDATTNQLLVRFTSGDEDVATIDGRTGTVTSWAVGYVTLYASTYAYGVVRRDSLRFMIGYPIKRSQNEIFICGPTTQDTVWTVDHIYPLSITVGVGGQVKFFTGCNSDLLQKPSTDTVDIVFDDPAIGPGGTVLIPGDFKNVTIPAEGVFHYHSVGYGFSGTVVAKSAP